MQKIYNKIIIIIFLLTLGCSTSWKEVKEGLGGTKRSTTDEFLVKKKQPLAMPPKWRDLPRPGEGAQQEASVEEVTDIEELIQLGKNEESSTNTDQDDTNLEDSLLKKIKKN